MKDHALHLTAVAIGLFLFLSFLVKLSDKRRSARAAAL
jgi:hypothetical protein